MTVHDFPCPTCSGPTRVTVGMVCQTCGTDYAPGDRDQQQAADNLTRAVRNWHGPGGATQDGLAGLGQLFRQALAAARDAEKARRDKLVADLRALIRSHAGLSDVVSIHDLRAVLDADR